MLRSLVVLGRRSSSASSCSVVVDEALKESIRKFDVMTPRPLTLRRILEVSSSAEYIQEINSFLQEEFRIRCAERICMLEEKVPNFKESEELELVYNKHLQSFIDMSGHSLCDDFIPVVRSIVERSRDEIPLLCKGMSKLIHNPDNKIQEKFLNKFMNEFILNRIGSNVLMSQYLAVATGDDPPHPTSIVDPHCNLTKICTKTAKAVQKLCLQETGYRPNIKVHSHHNMEHFAFIPDAISYILQELLKNSAVATANKKRNATGLTKYAEDPINVIVCADESRVMIHVADQAGGIPFEVSPHVWSYLYTTKPDQKEQQLHPDLADFTHSGATDLGGFGVGLPLSRLYASYLGGTINLVPLPGYGTHAYVFLPRLPEKMVESVPIRSTGWEASKPIMGGFIL